MNTKRTSNKSVINRGFARVVALAGFVGLSTGCVSKDVESSVETSVTTEQAQLANAIVGTWQLEQANVRLADNTELVVFGTDESCDAYAFDLALRLQIEEDAAFVTVRNDFCDLRSGNVSLIQDGSIVLEGGSIPGAIEIGAVVDDTLTVTHVMRVAAVDGPACVGGQGPLDLSEGSVELIYTRLDTETAGNVRGCN